jgi:phage shock protein A
MLDLEVIEARVPTPRMPERQPQRPIARFAPLAALFRGPIFSRTRDIFAANMTELLDRSEDPARMIRMIILEMEETLVHVRASAARSIADGKEMRRSLKRLDELQASWTEKAELALSKGREDLAKAALFERQNAADMADGLKEEIAVIDETLRG